MDVGARYSDVDAVIGKYQQGIEALENWTTQIDRILADFDQGGFIGQNGDEFKELLQRKQGLMNDLKNVYENAIQKLNQAKQRMRDAENEIRGNVGRI
jgi:uncharacterized protein YukE